MTAYMQFYSCCLMYFQNLFYVETRKVLNIYIRLKLIVFTQSFYVWLNIYIKVKTVKTISCKVRTKYL